VPRSFRPVAAVALAAACVVPLAAQTGPAPGVSNLPPEVLALACAPTAAIETPAQSLRITGGQDTHTRDSWIDGDLVTINAGTDNGIEVGQEFFVRRLQPDPRAAVSEENPGVVHTAGWIRVWAVDDEMSLATVTHGCSEFRTGDYLEPLVLPEPVPVPPPAAPLPLRTRAQRDNYGQVLFGDDRRESFSQGDFFIVDRGSDHGVDVGTQFVIYRDRPTPGNFLFELGEGLAVSVEPTFSTVLVTRARTAMERGDYVATVPPQAADGE